jgi:NifU-like domain
VVNEKEFQQKIRRLGTLVGELDEMPEGGAKVTARELIQLFMEVHGAGLERTMELVFTSEASGEAMIGKLGQDPIVRNLLLLYSLHPDDLETRVSQALVTLGGKLRKFDSEVELVGIRDGAVELRLHTSGHACGSTTKNIKSIVEEGIYEMAPDLASLTILEPEAESASGFVPLQSLLKNPLTAPALELQGAGVDGGD